MELIVVFKTKNEEDIKQATDLRLPEIIGLEQEASERRGPNFDSNTLATIRVGKGYREVPL